MAAQAEAALIDRHHEFHLVLLDLGLPQKAGTEVLRRILRAAATTFWSSSSRLGCPG